MIERRLLGLLVIAAVLLGTVGGIWLFDVLT